MFPAAPQSPASADRSPLRRRATPLLLTIAAHLLLLLMLVRLAPPFAKMASSGGQIISVPLAPEPQEETAQAHNAARTSTTRKAAAPTPLAPKPPPVKLPTTAAPWVLTPGLERFDLRQLPPSPHADSRPSDASAADEANGSGRSDRPVAFGPAGQPLYNAEWYREPTDAELAFYTQRARTGVGFGEIGCQTMPRFHVDNCIELAESPGSGYARAIKAAAWQFLVVPPRIGASRWSAAGSASASRSTNRPDRTARPHPSERGLAIGRA